MTEQNYNVLKDHKHIHETFINNKTVNTAHPGAQAISGVYSSIFGTQLNMSCGECFIDGLLTIYKLFNEEKQWQ